MVDLTILDGFDIRNEKNKEENKINCKESEGILELYRT